MKYPRVYDIKFIEENGGTKWLFIKLNGQSCGKRLYLSIIN